MSSRKLLTQSNKEQASSRKVLTSKKIDQGDNQPALANPVEKRGKTTKPKFNKMATSESLSTELMEKLMMADYCDEVDLFDRNQPTSKEHFRAFVKRTSSSYTVDTTSFFTRKGNPIPGGIYSLFGKYNGKNADEVRDELISWVYDNRTLVTSAGENVLKQDKKGHGMVVTNHYKQEKPS